MKLWPVEGNHFWLDGGAMFGNAPKALWSRWSPFDEQNRIPLAGRALLIQTDAGRNILLETGIGTFFPPDMRSRYRIEQPEHQLLISLHKLGLREKDIDAVLLSHLHFDHAGGLLSPLDEGEPRLLFPNARYYVSRQHWERARKPHLRERISFIPHLNQLLEASPRLILVDPESPPELGFPLTLHISDGHTVGLLVSEIGTPSGPLLFISDLVPGIPWVHLPIGMGYDRYPELLIDEKSRIFEKVQNARLFFTHDLQVACAQLKKDSSGKFFGEIAVL